MTEDIAQVESPSQEVLTAQEDATTPLRHQPEQKPAEPEAAPQAKSASDAIKAAMAKVEAEGEDKAKEEKPVVLKEPKAKEADGEQGEEGEEVPLKKGDKADAPKAETSLQSEGKHVKAPARLLPSERDVWVSTPRAIQAAWERMETEHAAASEQYRAASEFHESLRQYDDMAKQAGTSVKDALSRYVEFDKAVAQDFGRGVTQIIQANGKNPVEAVAQIMRAAGVLPAQLGAYLQGQPTQPKQQQQQPQQDPTAQAALQKVQQLEKFIQEQQQKAEFAAKEQEIQERVIAPAMAEMPRFNELSEDIAKILKSGMIDTSLSPDVKLKEAYFMADRLNPALYRAPDKAADLDDNSPPLGGKSISGAPGKSSTSSGKPKIMSVRDSIAAAMRIA